MEYLLRLEFLSIVQGAPVRMSEQVAMAFAEGIVDLTEHGAQRPVGPMAELEAHRIEDIAQNAWEGMQPHWAVRILDTVFAQQGIDPFG